MSTVYESTGKRSGVLSRSRRLLKTMKKGKKMQEDSVKVTCDGCGKSRTFVLGRDKRADFAPWYVLGLDVSFRSVGQGVRPPMEGEPIDACSPECAAKAMLQRLPPLPKALEPLSHDR